jgi:hypothetical protein
MQDEIRLKKAPQGIRSAIEREVWARKSLYQERDLVMHKIRRMRLMRHRPYMPKAYQRQLGGENAIKQPIMLRLVQTGVNAVAKGFPTLYVEPIDSADQGAADELGNAINLLLQATENMSAVPFLYTLYFNLFGDGLAVTKTQPGPWSGFPLPVNEQLDDPHTAAVYMAEVAQFKADNPLPFVTRTVDPLTAYPPVDEYGRGVFMESGWRGLSEVLKQLNLMPDPRANSALTFSKVPEGKPWPDLEFPPGLPPNFQVHELWSDTEAAVWFQGSSDIWIFDNPTGKKPYTWGFAEPTGVHDPANVGMSIVFPLYYIAPWIDTLSGIMTAWSLFAAPTPYTTRDPVPGQQPTKDTKIEMYQPGKMYQFPTGVKPGILSPPPVGDSVLGFLNFLIEAADRGGLPSLVSGSGVGSRLPALTFQAAFEAATDRLRPAVVSAEKIIAGTIRKELEIIAASGIPVRVNGWDYSTEEPNKKRTWAVIKPEEAAKMRYILATLQIDSTQDLIAKGTHAQFMVSAQLWDIAQAMRFAGVKDVTKTKNNIAADTAWRMALQPLAQMILQQDPDYQKALQMQQQGQNQPPSPTAPPMGMAPNAGPVPKPATGLGGGSPEGPRAADGALVTAATGVIIDPEDGAPPEIGGHNEQKPGDPPGPGRNRANVPAGRGGGRRGTPTQKPRGNRASPFGRT